MNSGSALLRVLCSFHLLESLLVQIDSILRGLIVFHNRCWICLNFLVFLVFCTDGSVTPFMKICR